MAIEILTFKPQINVSFPAFNHQAWGSSWPSQFSDHSAWNRFAIVAFSNMMNAFAGVSSHRLHLGWFRQSGHSWPSCMMRWAQRCCSVRDDHSTSCLTSSTYKTHTKSSCHGCALASKRAMTAMRNVWDPWKPLRSPILPGHHSKNINHCWWLVTTVVLFSVLGQSNYRRGIGFCAIQILSREHLLPHLITCSHFLESLSNTQTSGFDNLQ